MPKFIFLLMIFVFSNSFGARFSGESVEVDLSKESLDSFLKKYGNIKKIDPLVRKFILENSGFSEIFLERYKGKIKFPFLHKGCIRNFDMRFCQSGRNRGLTNLEEKFQGQVLLEDVFKMLETNPKSILEVGSGTGRVLLELGNIYKGSQLIGINKEPFKNETSAQFFIKLNKFYKIIRDKKDQEDFLKRAELMNFDINKVSLSPLDKKKFDLIVTQHTMPYLKNKLKILESLINLLNVGGVGILHIPSLVFSLTSSPKDHKIGNQNIIFNRIADKFNLQLSYLGSRMLIVKKLDAKVFKLPVKSEKCFFQNKIYECIYELNIE